MLTGSPRAVSSAAEPDCPERHALNRRPGMKPITCIEDLRRAAARRVPRAFFDYVEGGSYAEQTLRANCADFERIKFRQRVLVDVANRDMRTTILGEPAALPLALAPVGLTGMQRGDGEILACRVAQEMGIPYCLPTMSVCSIEDVAAAVGEAVLVSAPPHEGSWLHALARRAGGGGTMQRFGRDSRFAGVRTAAPRYQERHGHAASPAPQNCPGHGNQTSLGTRYSAGAA